MALSDISPQDILGETTQAKRTASALLALAVYVDQNADELWVQYGDTWPAMSLSQKKVVVNSIASDAGIVLTAVMVTWFVQFTDLMINERYGAVLLAKLKAQESQLDTKLTSVRAQIAELEG